MTVTVIPSPLSLERTCGLIAVAFSGHRRSGARLMTGVRRSFGVDRTQTIVEVPYPPPQTDWTTRTLTCGVALQCSPSKEDIGRYPLHELSPRELAALTIVEAEVALGWIAEHWPGLVPELNRILAGVPIPDHPYNATEMLRRADVMARSRDSIVPHPLLGQLPLQSPPGRGLAAAIKRTYGRMPWSSPRSDAQRLLSIPVGGEGGVRNSNMPPPSRPEDEDIEIRPDQRVGIPYPEWNAWQDSFLVDHVAVLERKHRGTGSPGSPVSTDLRRWFAEHTHRSIKTRMEDGSDLDVDAYVNHHLDLLTGDAAEPRVFRELLPTSRDVTTALLLDGSSSLGIRRGEVFDLELACADALSRAMMLTKERHGVFVFSGNTRHRVEVNCLKDFDDPRLAIPSGSGLVTGGYTRLGAPIRHLTTRLLAQPCERRLLIVIGDGLISDEGYEGRYAWADVAHSLDEADEAGVSVYYIGVGPARVDPLPEVFGPRRSQRIRLVEQLPQVLAQVHRELVSV
ncbi:nitric oxide reductase activation protein NorD [Williamsia sp.]|uniref:nitric oxide reductase activation protein NorD n=1 Tax=Williamsia sp. TaxID=1872085 RepID=UPI002F94305B